VRSFALFPVVSQRVFNEMPFSDGTPENRQYDLDFRSQDFIATVSFLGVDRI
jgi:hypothetical protein